VIMEAPGSSDFRIRSAPFTPRETDPPPQRFSTTLVTLTPFDVGDRQGHFSLPSPPNSTDRRKCSFPIFPDRSSSFSCSFFLLPSSSDRAISRGVVLLQDPPPVPNFINT